MFPHNARKNDMSRDEVIWSKRISTKELKSNMPTKGTTRLMGFNKGAKIFSIACLTG
jgi:hypothetical protein